MSVDVDAVNERLSGLVTLLQAVGIDSLSKTDVDRVSKNLAASSSKGSGGLPDAARQLNDDQIEAIIRKLQLAQSEAPQIIAALEAHAEARSLNGGASRGGRQQAAAEEEEEEEEVEEEEEEDEDGNYPVVGPGVSDDISVVSDLTTPTVLAGVPVPDEEHYRDTLPPMIVGGGVGQGPPMIIAPPKKKNALGGYGANSGGAGGLVPPTRGRNLPAPRGGAAAARLRNYQDTMAKLHDGSPAPPGHMMANNSLNNSGSNTMTMNSPGGYGNPNMGGGFNTSKKSPMSKSGSVNGGSVGGGTGIKKKPQPVAPPREMNNFSDLAGARSQQQQLQYQQPGGGWDSGYGGGMGGGGGGGGSRNTFESRPRSQTKAPSTVIDNDGFLIGESFDPFASNDNPFTSNAAGDLAYSHNRRDDFGNFDSRSHDGSGQRSNRPRQKKPTSSAADPQRNMQSTFSQSTRKERTSGSSTSGNSAGARPRRARRASLAM